MGHLASVDQCGRHYFHLHMQFNRIFSGNWVLTHRTRWLTQYRRHFYWFAEMAPLVSWRRTGRKAPSEPVVAYFVGERHASLSLRIVNGYTMRLTTTSTSIPQCNYILLDDIILQTGVLLKPVFFLLIKEWEYIHDKVQLRADQSHYDDVTMSATKYLRKTPNSSPGRTKYWVSLWVQFWSVFHISHCIISSIVALRWTALWWHPTVFALK